MPTFRQITIIGTGLIGGSFALAAKANGFRGKIVGCDRNPVLVKAKRIGAIDAAITDPIAACTSSDLVLLAIAGPVIAGTSLFGGRGSVWSALLGALVIGSISNGMDLLGYESPTKFIVTGAVLLGAVVLDSVARLGRQQSGRV